jgi:hypothetical protein
MISKRFDPSRRRLFRQGAVIAGGAVAAGLISKTRVYAQTAKTPKAVAKYQAQPHGTQQCDGCALFVPGKAPSADGTCKVVDGSISPKGWCMFFAAKS